MIDDGCGVVVVVLWLSMILITKPTTHEWTVTNFIAGAFKNQ
jgi:hypothetical protein